MIWRILARLCTDKLRTNILFNFLLESAMARPNSTIELKLTVIDMTASEIVVEKIEDGRYEATLGEEKE